MKVFGYYILEGTTPVPVFDILEWGEKMQSCNRIVARTTYNKILVSTVFLGLDHSWEGSPPIVFETMIFGGKYDQYQMRYATWEEAKAGHEIACKKVVKSNLMYLFIFYWSIFLKLFENKPKKE